VLDYDGTGVADLRAISCIRVDLNPVEPAADLRIASMIQAGDISLRGPVYRQRGASYYLRLRDDYLELLKREKQTEADRQMTDQHLGEGHRTAEIPIVETAVFPAGKGIYNMDGVAYAAQCLAEWIVFLANRGSYASGPLGPSPRPTLPSRLHCLLFAPRLVSARKIRGSREPTRSIRARRHRRAIVTPSSRTS